MENRIRSFVSLFPGWLFMAGMAFLSNLISQSITVGNRHPLEGVTIAILMGLLLGNLLPSPLFLQAGILNFEIALKAGIVLLGMGLSFFAVLEIGAKAISVVVLCLLIAPLLFIFIGRKAGLSEKMNVLIGVGTTICGTTAIAITAPVIEAEGDDVSYAIGTISLVGMAAMFILPVLARFLGLKESVFGLWAGTAVHATPQVVAAGYMYGTLAGQVATVAKLTRNIFMAPAVFLIRLWHSRKTHSASSRKTRYWKAIPHFLFGFLALAVIRTIGDGTSFIPSSEWQWVVRNVSELGKFLVLVAMAGIGLNTRIRAMHRIGLRPFLVGLVASVLLAAISLILIHLLGIS